MEKEVKPIAIPGIHKSFFKLFKKISAKYENPRVLEVGAGHGAFTKKLYDNKFDVSACDLFPDIFYFDKIECKFADITKSLPYPDNSFDIVTAVEVMEHIHDHTVFMKECNRVLKQGGILAVSTPNILSLKSRIRFLYSGFYYSFEKLDHNNTDGLQHLSSITIDQYANLGISTGFRTPEVHIDKKQSTSKIYLFFLYPLIRLYCKLKNIDYKTHNKIDFLTGRILFMIFRKK